MSRPDRLTVEGAVIAYGPDRAAVDGVDLTLNCGRVTALLGPSGSGKSTLLRAIAGLETLNTGEICFGDELWSGNSVHKAPETRRCGVVFQDYALFPHLNALDNVGFGLKGLTRSDRRHRAQRQLEGVELGHRAKAFPHELSGGEQQRVALARALATEPDVMLLDEPFSGLDRRLRSELRDTTADALKASGAATLIVTHDADEALSLADTIALMNAGRIIQIGAPDTLYLKPASLAAARLLGDVEVFEAEVSSGAAQTPLGSVAADGFNDGQAVLVLIRPEGVIVSQSAGAGARAKVLERRLAGGHARVTCCLENDRRIQARAALTDPIATGGEVYLTLDTHFVSVVGAEAAQD